MAAILTIPGQISSGFDVSEDANYFGDEAAIAFGKNGPDMCDHKSGVSWKYVRWISVLQG